MSSPVQISFSSFIKLQRKQGEALYMQIVYQFIHAVKSKILQSGDQLPGSRRIAEALHLHRKTVLAALHELEAQGWIESQPNVGTFVRDPESHLSGEKTIQPPIKAAFTFHREMILDIPATHYGESLYFSDGTADYRLIDVKELLRFYAAVLKRSNRGINPADPAYGSAFFKEQLSFYLNISRGFHLSRDYILPISSREQLFSILTRLLIRKGDTVLVEALSYYLPNMIFSPSGAQLKTIPIDSQGIQVDYIQKHFSPGEIRFLYMNSRCQYPSTRPLSEARKQALLELAEAYDFIILEDDIDFESAAPKAGTSSLFKKDGGKRVIYIGALGSFLHPSFQMHFLIAPKDLLEEAKKQLNIFGKANFMLEKALGEMIQQGDFLRYQRKARKSIEERKQWFAQRLRHYFKDAIDIQIPPSGLAFWILFNTKISLIRLQQICREYDLFIPNICLYQNRDIQALRLGFAHLNPVEIEAAIARLHQAFQKLIPVIPVTTDKRLPKTTSLPEE